MKKFSLFYPTKPTKQRLLAWAWSLVFGLVSCPGLGMNVPGNEVPPDRGSAQGRKNGPVQGTTVMPKDSSTQRYASPPVPKSLELAGEPVPLYLDRVREALERELLSNTYFHSRTLLYIKRSARWFPLLDSILKAERVPTDFKYLALVESDFGRRPSPSGAAGFWQMLPATARERGLIVNEEVDQRYDVVKATQAAAEHLRKLYDYFGSYTLSAAAYNCGIGCVRAVMHRQGADSYYEMHLNRETGRYVYRILAVKCILQHQAQYGFDVRMEELYAPFTTYEVKVDTSVHSWPRLAAYFGISAGTLYRYNPWIQDDTLHNEQGRGYEVRLPSQRLRDTLSRMGPEAQIRRSDFMPPVFYAPEERRFSSNYRVRKGDRIEALAKRFETSVAALMEQNGLKTYRLRVGQRLKTPPRRGRP